MRLLAPVLGCTLLLLCVLGTPAQVSAAAPTIVSINIEPFVAHVGDQVTLTVVVEHDAGVTIVGPGQASDFGALTYVAEAEPVVVATASGERTTLAYTLVPFAVGNAAMQPIEIQWRGPGEEGVITSPTVPYTVDSVLAPGDDTILPLKAQFEIPQPAPPPYVPATFVAIFAGLTALGYWFMRRTIAISPPPLARFSPAAPPLDPAVGARAQLNALAADNIAATDPAAYYARIAGTVRQYISARYGFPGYAMTCREMESGMTDAGIDRWPARLTANLLEQSDAVQFAVFRPAMERREQDLTAAYEIIDLTSVGEGGTPRNLEDSST